jgi:hypothetical protein
MSDPDDDTEPTLEELRPRLEEVVRSFLEADELVRDDDGDIPIRMGNALVFIRLLDLKPPVVAMFTAILRHVPSSGELLEALNDINGKIMFARVFWADDQVFLSTELSAGRVTRDGFAFACIQIGSLADHLGGELGERFGARPADRPKTLLN